MIRTNHVDANEVNLEMVIGKILVLLPFHSLFSTVNTFWYLYHINKKEKKILHLKYVFWTIFK